jgi:hypothetical protein
MSLRLILLVTLVNAGLAHPAPAQDTANGTIAGVVTDSSGAVLPGVTVEAASPALIEKIRNTVTDAEGRYRIGALRPGVYTITFSLPGFRGVRREGLELTTGFTATVNADLAVGAIEEAIVVTGTSPLVDTKNSSQQTVLSGELVRSLPLAKNSGAYVTLLPGAVQSSLQNMDVGGTKGETEGQFAIHGGRPNDGYRFREGLSDGPLSGTFGTNPFVSINPTTIQEVTIQLTGGLTAEAPTGGTQTNVVLRDGGNTLSGTIQVDVGHKDLQSDNIDGALRARGVRTPSAIKELRDLAAGVGGPIRREKVWFFVDGRDWQSLSYLPGNYYNRAQGTLFYEPDLGRPAYTGTRNTSGGVRVTWQASEKDKIVLAGRYEQTLNPYFSLANGLSSPEGTRSDAYRPQKMTQGNWTRPITNRLLLQVGALKLGGVLGTRAEDDSISVLNRLTNYRYGSAQLLRRAFSQANTTTTLSYVTGAHSFRVGGSYLAASRNDTSTINQSISYTFAGTVPESVTYYAFPLYIPVALRTSALFAQDQWTLEDFTLNLGVRYDHFNGHSPANQIPAGRWVPARSFDAVNDAPDWNDINPRMGIAYNLFGKGRTVVKANLGRFLPFESNDRVRDFSPSAATVATATRQWRDANGDYAPQEIELGPLSNTAFGESVIQTKYADDVVHGFGVRPFSWQGSVSVQHELRPGIALNAGYFRTWYDNFLVTDNLLVTPADYQTYCVNGPSNPQLPGGGGERICGLMEISQAKFGRFDNLVKHASDYGKQTEVYNGFDFTAQARFGDRGLLAGGVSTSRTVTDNCEVRAQLPETAGTNAAPSRFCEVRPPWSAATQLKLNGTYTLPWDVRIGGVYQNVPGLSTTATYVTNVATNPEILTQLGRPLSSGANGTVSVELITPNALFLDGRISMLNFNVAKILRVGKARVEPTVDVYNALNANPVQVQVVRYGPAWRNVTGVLQARMVKVGARVDF